ncbi:MAG: efflux RND transporter permease subunit [Phycisphaerae bacterium]|nr:efflux RND transporter permease subunit [Phycisphaerae bacterium]
MIRYFAQHPTAANLLMLLFLASGALTLPQLRRETFPDFAATKVEIRVVYAGATAEEIETSICRRLEDAIDGVRFVKEVRSDARPGIGIVVVEMDDTGEMIPFKDEIQAQVDAITDWPEEAEDPVIEQLNVKDRVLSLLVSGPMSAADLNTYCEQLKDRLRQLPDAPLVRVQGFADRQFRVSLSSSALRRYGLSAADVAAVIERQNVALPAGVLETGARDIVVHFAGERTSTQSLADLVLLAQPGGAEVRISDVGTITEQFELREQKVLLNGHRAGMLLIEKTKNQDTIRVAQAIKQFVAAEQTRQPNVDLAISMDVSTLVEDRLSLLVNNGLQGMLLVFATMWLFFNLQLSFWVVMSLPVAFLGAFTLLPHIDLTINMLTMVGLLLALGILMDDGIVIAENIAAQRAAGRAPLDAVVVGTQQVAGGVLSSFLTTICVLGPLTMLSGDIGKVLLVVPIILILVLCVSLIEAFLILPHHLAHSFKHTREQRDNPLRLRLDAAFDFLRERVVGRLVDRLIEWRYAWLGVVAMVFLFTVGMIAGGVVKIQAFPELDGDTVHARILLPAGTPLERTEQIVEQLTSALRKVNADFKPRQPGEADLVRQTYVEFNTNADAFETGPHVATVVADLLTADQRNARVDAILQAWREAAGPVPDAISVNYTEVSIGPAGRNIEVQLRGSDLATLEAAANAMQAYLDKFRGVYNLTTDLRRGMPEVRVRLHEGAYGLGLDAANVARQIRTAFHGATADEIQVDAESYEIDVQFAAEDQDSYGDLTSFYCMLPGGGSIPLEAVADFIEARGWSRISRVDGVRTVSLRGDTDSREANTNQVLKRLESEFVPAMSRDYPGVQLVFEGETKEAATTQASMLRGTTVGLIGMFILLSFQFRSYIEPVIVMAAIPLALIGVVLGHMLMRLDLTMPSMLGLASLAGIVVNDSILLVLFLKLQRSAGTPPLQAAGQASRQRLRAVLITSATTIAGLLPLTFERSLQAQILIPLAVSIVFGLLASTVLVLSVIPCLYMVLNDLGLTAHIEEEGDQQS